MRQTLRSVVVVRLQFYSFVLHNEISERIEDRLTSVDFDPSYTMRPVTDKDISPSVNHTPCYVHNELGCNSCLIARARPVTSTFMCVASDQHPLRLAFRIFYNLYNLSQVTGVGHCSDTVCAPLTELHSTKTNRGTLG